VTWLSRLSKVLSFTVLAAMMLALLFQPLSVVGLVAAAWIGDTTGWYRVEDYMCTIPEGCEDYIAERKRLRENATRQNSH
jgi:hypothetical protein